MLQTILNLLPIIGPVIARAPEFVALVDQVSDTLGEDDQAKLKSALAAAQEKSDAEHDELQDRLS